MHSSSRNGRKIRSKSGVECGFLSTHFNGSCEDLESEQGSHVMEHGQLRLDEQKIEQ